MGFDKTAKMKYVLVSGGQYSIRASLVKFGRVLTESQVLFLALGRESLVRVLQSAHNVEIYRGGNGRLIANSLFYRSAVEDDWAQDKYSAMGCEEPWLIL
jgi:hypothetical protein